MNDKAKFINQIKDRTKKLAIDIILLYDGINKSDSIRVIGRQLIRSASSVAANYRAACLARSRRDFFAKISIVVEEADETLFWLEMLEECNYVSKPDLEALKSETLEIIKIVSKARKNAYS